jgi:hypothetical protein
MKKRRCVRALDSSGLWPAIDSVFAAYITGVLIIQIRE